MTMENGQDLINLSRQQFNLCFIPLSPLRNHCLHQMIIRKMQKTLRRKTEELILK